MLEIKLFDAGYEEANGGDAIFDLQLTNKDKLLENVNMEGNLGDNDHKMIELKIVREGREGGRRAKK